LLVFNFAMDRKNPLLSHQYDAVIALAKNFDHVTVITGKVGEIGTLENVKIVSTDWRQGNALGNLVRLTKRAIPVILRGNYQTVFFHMTDLQCAILSPVVLLRGRKQFLWYAHSFRSRYLVFASWWVTKIVTSTPGSCPITGSKVIAIGQSIDEERFQALPFNELKLAKLVHIGRFDKSKNIQCLIDSAREIRRIYPDLELTLIGSPANEESRAWAQGLVNSSESEVRNGWLIFRESIPRENFPKEVAQNGCFFHAYMGSLDKTLMESTMLRVPVITLNPEYRKIFGSWSKSNIVDLEDEYVSLREMTRDEIELELDRRLVIATTEHSLKHWVKELTSLLE